MSEMFTKATSWTSYPSIFAIGHKALEHLFDNEVLVEEKIDGSQFSFGLINGELHVKSKGQEFPITAPPDMFQKACDTVQEIAPLLHPDWTYRTEYLSKPKHNTLAYDRAPDKYLIVFDINCGHEDYLNWNSKDDEAHRLGLECVPLLSHGMITNFEDFMSLMETQSILGGQKIEGMVIKNYAQFGQDKKVLMGKFVSEHFKEIHGGEWAKNNPPQGDFIELLAKKYKTAARWDKSIQHLREAGLLVNEPKDIGALMKEIPEDVLKECEDEMKADLFKYAWPKIKRIIIAGFPEYYKELLAKSQFDETTTT